MNKDKISFSGISRFFSHKLFPLIKKWSEESGIEVYVVGGACRDLISQRYCANSELFVPKDYDLCIESPDGAKPLVDFLSTTFNVEIKKDFREIGTMVIEIDNKVDLEIAMTRKEIYNGKVRKPDRIEFAKIDEDYKRRDFCCNAVYYNIRTEDLIDPSGKGISDAGHKIIRTVKDPETSFREDPLRMIRALRFCHTRNYKLEQETESKLHWYPEYDQLSLDLIRPEFEQLITAYDSLPDSSFGRESIIKLHDTGLLKHIIPELEEAWGFNQNNPHHSMNLTDHLLCTLDYAQTVSIDTKLDGILLSPHTSNDLNILRFSALLHDIGKYKSFILNKNNTFSFFNHEELSGDMAEKIVQRLGYSKEFSKQVGDVIRCHMILTPFWDPIAKKYVASDQSTNKAWERLYKKSNNQMELALFLIDADNNTHAPESCKKDQVAQFIKKYSTLQQVKLGFGFTTNIPRLPNGDMIRDALKLSKEELPLIREIQDIMEEIIPLQKNYSNLKEADILEIYLGIFDHVYYIRETAIEGVYNILDSYTSETTDMVVRDIATRKRIRKIFENGKDTRIMPPDNTGKRTLCINSQTFPKIYMQCQLEYQVREAYKKISEGIRQIASLPGFKYFSADYVDGDAVAISDFTDQKVVIL